MIIRIAAALAVAVLYMLPAAASARTQSVAYALLGSTGKHESGSRTLRVTINALRYDGAVITDVHTITPPPDIIGPFLPKSTSVSDQLATQATFLQHLVDFAPSTGVRAKPSPNTDDAERALSKAQDKVAAIDRDTSRLEDEVTLELGRGDSVARDANSTSYANDVKQLLDQTQVTGNKIWDATSKPLSSQWPSQDLADVSKAVAAAQRAHEDDVPATRDRLAEIEKLRKALAPDPTAAFYAKLATRLEQLRKWRTVFLSTDAAQFAVEHEFACAEGLNADAVLVSVTATDRTAADPAKAKQTKEIETVDCPSRLSLTHGFGYSNIPLQAYKVAPAFVNGSNGTTVQYSQNDSGRPYLMTAIGHYRIVGQEPIALHLSVSATTSQSQIVGGMVGLSVSFHRALYVTAGVFRSEVESLQNGYSVGQSVPSSLTLGTTKTSVNRFGLAISFPILKGENGLATATRGTAQAGTGKGS